MRMHFRFGVKVPILHGRKGDDSHMVTSSPKRHINPIHPNRSHTIRTVWCLVGVNHGVEADHGQGVKVRIRAVTSMAVVADGDIHNNADINNVKSMLGSKAA